MADEEQLKILKLGVATWNKWREEYFDVSVDLTGAKLEDMDLSQANLFRADLREATLCNTALIQANLESATLLKANLSGANLRSARLESANLLSANLKKSILSDANLRWATLKTADLSNAKAQQVNFQRSDLTWANLQGANLVYAVFDETDLHGAEFFDVSLGKSCFLAVNLSNAKGLDACRHFGPSRIDFQTLTLSECIPEIFLRGCGLPDEFIQFLPSFQNQPIQFYSCFISYSHADKSFARRLHDALQGRGIRCWLDEHQLLPGDNVYTEIDRGIRLWDKVLLCCSRNSLENSWWVHNEVESALRKEQQLYKERGKEVLALIPLDLDGFVFSSEWNDGKKTQLLKRFVGDFKGWETDNSKFEKQFELVVKALRADGGGKPKPPKSLL